MASQQRPHTEDLIARRSRFLITDPSAGSRVLISFRPELDCGLRDRRTTMLSMRDHDVDDYAALRDMDATDVGALSDDDQGCLRELGEYLISTKAWHRFSIWLLHKHFEPDPGEVFVERSIAWPPQTHTTPMDRAAFSPTGLHATAVRFDAAVDSGVGLVGMEFTEPADFGPVTPISSTDEAVLSGIADILRSRGKADRFGVRVIRNQLGLSAEQLLAETCSRPRRALQCRVVERGAIVAHNAIETTWQFKPVIIATGPTPTMEPAQTCETVCMEGDEGHNSDHNMSDSPPPPQREPVHVCTGCWHTSASET
jgi:hypothetical protein